MLTAIVEAAHRFQRGGRGDPVAATRQLAVSPPRRPGLIAGYFGDRSGEDGASGSRARAADLSQESGKKRGRGGTGRLGRTITGYLNQVRPLNRSFTNCASSCAASAR
jgi:hypothetical protein